MTKTYRKTYKSLGILAVAALAAGLLGAAKPAAASSIVNPLHIGSQTVIAQHFGDYGHNSDYRRDERRREEIRLAELRRQQEIRRIEERRREERLRDHRHDVRSHQDFRDGDRHDGSRDWHENR